MDEATPQAARPGEGLFPAETQSTTPSCSSPQVEPTIRQRNFTEQTPDGPLYYQIIDLGRQYYVWVALGGAKLQELHLAIQTPSDPRPSVATLIRGGGTSDGEALAQRLALRLKKPILCSCNIPSHTPMLQAIAERCLLRDLLAMEAERSQAPAAPAAAGSSGPAAAAASPGLPAAQELAS